MKKLSKIGIFLEKSIFFIDINRDSLAPKVGDELIKNNINAFVYGTTQYPITALNITINL